MMAENYTYMKPNVLVKELARRGLFGDLYYAEGEYIHELKALNEQTPWRRKWQTGHRRHHLPDAQPGADPPVDGGRSGGAASAARGAAITTATHAATSTRTRIAA